MPKIFSGLDSEMKYELIGIAFATAGLLGVISLLGLNTGPFGSLIAKILRYLFGVGAFVVPSVFILIGLRYIWTRQDIVYSIKFFGLALFYILLLSIYHHFKIPAGQEVLPESLLPGGGFVGGIILFSLRKLLGFYGTIIVLSALAICAFMMATTLSLSKGMVVAKEKAAEGITNAREAFACTIEEISAFEHESAAEIYDQEREREKTKKAARRYPAKAEENNVEVSPPPIEPTSEQRDIPSNYTVPPLSLLKKITRVRSAKMSREISDNTHILEETLKDFGVSAKVINICQGPAVTRYELEPAPGVKVSRIVNLSDDLALKLASPGIRIEAPIPGKAAIGIEVPNREVSGVALREVLENDLYQEAKSRLTVALGKDIAGQTVVADLSKMPHLLVAGSTGSGKSVCINTIINSILFKALPEEVKLILVDPKMVELSNYNGIPHLLVPVVTDAQQAASALRWSVQEMERRYTAFATSGVRDISRYNEMTDKEKLPLILIIIDELADLMMVAPVDVEDAIFRLAQKARAAGIHLVLATQRPSVDVITGTIKANVPSRISFAVSSQVDSRTILDMAGAEKLLGKGDMLFYPVGAPKPLRVQGAFVSDQEVEDLISYIKRQAQPEYAEGVTTCEGGSNDPKQNENATFEDELLEDAVCMVMELGQASTSMLQRKFRIGYTRAARLIDTMEEMKIVGPNMGSKPREILMTMEQANMRYFKKE